MNSLFFVRGTLMLYVIAIASCIYCYANASNKLPQIVNDVEGEDKCFVGDPMGPCRDRVITVKNFYKYPILVRIGCSGTESQIEDKVPASGEATLTVSAGVKGGLKKGQCQILTHKRTK